MSLMGKTILAIDPGPVLGLAKLSSSSVITSAQWDLTTNRRAHRAIATYLTVLHGRSAIDVIALEPFVFRKVDMGRNYINYLPAEYVGAIQSWAQGANVEVVLQPASSAVGPTAFWGDGLLGNRHLRSAGLWVPGAENVHQRDALRHLAYYATFTQGKKDLLLCIKTGSPYPHKHLNGDYITL